MWSSRTSRCSWFHTPPPVSTLSWTISFFFLSVFVISSAWIFRLAAKENICLIFLFFSPFSLSPLLFFILFSSVSWSICCMSVRLATKRRASSEWDLSYIYDCRGGDAVWQHLYTHSQGPDVVSSGWPLVEREAVVVAVVVLCFHKLKHSLYR